MTVMAADHAYGRREQQESAEGRKLFAFNDEALARRFPRLPDFLDLRTTYDPRGKFSNPFINWRPGHARSS
jgi:hypothetical protein